MNGFWYKRLVQFSRIFGPWLFIIICRIIAAGYFLFGRRLKESQRFYGALYPDRSTFHHLRCAFRQYQSFTSIHIDRFIDRHVETATFTTRDLHKLDTVIGRQGGILLMSHLGNWEIAASLLKQHRRDLRLLLYMGVKEKEGVERVQKDDLRKSGVTIIGVDQESSSPFSAVEGVRFLQDGGLVSMTGDIIWRSDQRKIRVDFLGHDAFVSEAPFVFALVSGAPLFVFFAFRTGRARYEVSMSDPIELRRNSRHQRREIIDHAAQQYADMLEDALRAHPFEWYHFDRFIHDN